MTVITQEDTAIPKQVSEDGAAAKEEIRRLLSRDAGTPTAAEPSTDEAVENQQKDEQEPEVKKPTYEDLEAKIESMQAEQAERQREIDRKFGTFGQQKEAMNATLAKKEEQLKAMSQELELIKKSKGVDSAEPSKTVDQQIEDLYEVYGQDFVDGVKKTIGQDFSKLEKRLEEQDTKIKQIAEREKAVQSAWTFWNDFEKLSPGALKLNGDPLLNVPADKEFLSYLDQNVPIYEGSTITRTRRDIAEQLAQSGDHQALARLFNGFVNQKKESQGAKPQVDLSERVSPKPIKTVGSDAPIQKDGKPVFKESDMDTWARDIQEGRSNLTKAEFQAKTEEFNQAAREGRVLWGQ